MVYLYKYIILIMVTFKEPNLQAKIIKRYRHLFNYICLQVLVNNNAYITITLQSCLHYSRKTSLFKYVILLFWSWLCKEACCVQKHQNIMPIIDRGVFHNYYMRWIFSESLIWQINLFWVIGGFYIGKCYCSSTITLALHTLNNLAIINLVDFHNSLNHQNKLYAKFSSYTVCSCVQTVVL